MSERVYVGKGKLIGKYQQLKIGIEVAKLTPNERGYCNIIITTMREEDKFGNTHTAYIDDYVPQQRRDQQNDMPPVTEDHLDLPF
jgi:hypothetical protein